MYFLSESFPDVVSLNVCTPVQEDPEAEKFYEEFLNDQKRVLHPNHHLMVRAKAKLVLAMRSPPTSTHMHHKLHLCQAVLSVIQVILPGTDILPETAILPGTIIILPCRYSHPSSYNHPPMYYYTPMQVQSSL